MNAPSWLGSVTAVWPKRKTPPKKYQRAMWKGTRPDRQQPRTPLAAQDRQLREDRQEQQCCPECGGADFTDGQCDDCGAEQEEREQEEQEQEEDEEDDE